MTWVLIAIVGSLLNLALVELFDWCPWLAERVIRRAALRLPVEVRDRYADEWLAEAQALPGRRMSTLVFAAQVYFGASKVRLEVTGQVNATALGVATKRALDGVLSASALFLFAPLLVVATVAVRISWRGPALRRERCVGLDGEFFELLTFRTTSSLSGDGPRLSAVGRFLRVSALSELPQLVNVLRGDMSLVGPRPDRPRNLDAVSGHEPTCHERLSVKPGITGLAQLQGLGRAVPLAERITLDRYYVMNHTVALDLKILARTFYAAFR
jgi:lipopolysaccharide/colanic/teichoic acid biosynthesis glycosyltransferase